MVGCVACCGMREGISIEVSAADRDRLERIVADRNSPQKHVWRARIILATAAGCGTAEIMRRAEVSKPCVWRWQERFMREGVAGLVRDKTRKPGAAALAAGPWSIGCVALTLGDAARRDDPLDRPRDGGGQRRIAALGAADLGGARPRSRTGCGASSCPPIRRSPAKLRDVVGLYLDPPAHALVLSVDEKSHVWMAPGSQEKS